MNQRFLVAVLAYVVPSFAIAYPWHLVVFHPLYEALAIYREDVLVPFGLIAMSLQGVLSAAVYPRLFGAGSVWRSGLEYGGLAGLLSWTFTTLAVAAKFPMTSVGTFLLLETGFTIVQFAVVGPLTAWVYRPPHR